MMFYSNRTMYYVIMSKLLRMALRCILENSDEWWNHLVHSLCAQLDIYGTWWQGSFICRTQYLQIAGSHGQLLRQHRSTSLQKTTNTNGIKLLYFARLEGVLHDIRYLSDDFTNHGRTKIILLSNFHFIHTQCNACYYTEICEGLYVHTCHTPLQLDLFDSLYVYQMQVLRKQT